jgi:CBS domain-containing protein
MIVRELMTSNPKTVRPDTTVKEALRVLDEHNVTSLPVVDGAGHIVGVVSEADLIRDLVAPDNRLHAAPVEPENYDRPRYVDDVMTAHPVTVRPDTDLATAVDLATTTGVKSLPVVEGDRVVGMLSRRDVVRMLARSDQQLEGEVDALLLWAGLRDWLVDVHDGIAEITGPPDGGQRVVARVIAGSVPGVVEVRVR